MPPSGDRLLGERPISPELDRRTQSFDPFDFAGRITGKPQIEQVGGNLNSLLRNADITGQSLPVLTACGRILFVPLSVPAAQVWDENPKAGN